LFSSSLLPSIDSSPKLANFADDERVVSAIERVDFELEEEKSSLLLQNLTEDESEDVYSDLYVATKSYLNETEFSTNGSDESRHYPINFVVEYSPQPDYDQPPTDPSFINLVISSLKLQGKQNFAVDDFEHRVDITNVFNAFQKPSADITGIDEETDESGDSGSGSGGSGTEQYDASGSEESGSGVDGDATQGDSSGSDGASGSYGDTSGDGSSGGGDATGGQSSGMDGASGAYGDSSGEGESGSGSKTKKKRSCVIL